MNGIMKVIKVFFYTLSVCLFLVSCRGGQSKQGQNQNQNPNQVDSTLLSGIKPMINVYIENSGSMDGYVYGSTEFSLHYS